MSAPSTGQLPWTTRITPLRARVHSSTGRSAAVLLCAVMLVWGTRSIWTLELGRSLVSAQEPVQASAILIENFDPNYLLFERARSLSDAGLASRVFVPVAVGGDGIPSRVGQGVAEVMARIARLDSIEIIPVHEVEPISLNAAGEVLSVLRRERVTSVLVLTSGLRSRRSFLVNRAILGRAGIAVLCIPVFGVNTPENWTTTWHGIQEVSEQFLKLQYYRFYVLPAYAWSRARVEHG